MILYHGTNKKFANFDISKARIGADLWGGGIYTTDSLDIAKGYANGMFRKYGGGRYILEVSLDPKKTFDVDAIYTGALLVRMVGSDPETFARGAGLLKYGSDRYTVLNKLKDGSYELTGAEVFKGMSNGMLRTDKARTQLVAMGYDCLRYNGGLLTSQSIHHNVYVSWRPEEVYIRKVFRIEGSDLIKEDNPISPLNIARELMPQINEPEDFLQFLGDMGITWSEKLVYPHEIKSAQGQFDRDKIDSIARTIERTDPNLYFISNDGYLLDGNHRWIARTEEYPKVKMSVIQIDMGILDILFRIVDSAGNITRVSGVS